MPDHLDLKLDTRKLRESCKPCLSTGSWGVSNKGTGMMNIEVFLVGKYSPRAFVKRA